MAAKPTPAEMLAQARQLHNSLAAFDPKELTAEALAILESDEFQGSLIAFDAIAKALPEDHKVRNPIGNISVMCRQIIAMMKQEKMAQEIAASVAADRAA